MFYFFIHWAGLGKHGLGYIFGLNGMVRLFGIMGYLVFVVLSPGTILVISGIMKVCNVNFHHVITRTNTAINE